MRRVMLGVAFVLAVQSASAAVEYEFRQISRSDLESVPPTDFTGRAIIDGDRSRVEFLSGTGYPPGTYLISNSASRSMIFVDPAKKAYLEINAGSVSNALGAAKLTIANKKVDLTQMEDHPVIAGLPTGYLPGPQFGQAQDNRNFPASLGVGSGRTFRVALGLRV